MRLLILLLPLAGCEILLDAALPVDAKTHPCTGNRTDALWLDDAQNAWVGCGSTTVGTGLYRTDNAGRSWDEVAGFETMRVSSLQRADDGLLYVGGIDTVSDIRVLSLDGDQVADVFVAGDKTWNRAHMGTYRRTPAGLEVAESLTGSDLAFRLPGGQWTDGGSWAGGGFQMLDLEVTSDGGLVGVGSTIIQPPTVFIQTADDPIRFDPVTVGDREGELWGVDADSAGLIAGGVDQDANVGLVYWTSSDGSDAGDWQELDVSTIVDGSTWIRAVCRRGDRLLAVGEVSTRNAGLLLESLDGGASWREVTPGGAPDLTACAMLDDGTLALAGASGWFAIE